LARVVAHLLALAASYVLALPIAWNREKEARSAGLRTFPLVAIATCSVVLATDRLLEGAPEGMARIVQGLMSGMGFIGGGAILKTRHYVHGTATAASLWATGAMGVAVGLGAYDVAVMLSLVTFLTLRVMLPFKRNAEEDVEPDEDDKKVRMS
ncbi:MgtC/SapB family protein, partial [Rhodopseudomonas palustris]|uniref:MgtC/SapB family protein n=2 Tax=Rhodopseudomonas TaxID=1073 RepID=UPI0005C88A3E